MTLFEDRSRGRITLKLDPSLNNNNTINANSTTYNNNNNNNTKKSPNNSPMMHYIQPRTSTPIRISPPNSPESVILKTQQHHQSSPLSKSTTKNGEGKTNNKGLVMAN
jgi:protein Tob/BTG